MNPHFDRALLLFQQGRHEMAEKELRQVIGAQPDEAHPRSLLALCLSERKHFPEATEEARQAIALGPDEPFSHYALAHVLCDRNRPDEALTAAEEAIRLDPFDADYCALKAQCHHNLKQWSECLSAAERGLVIDAEHLGCTNLRAIALVRLGRRDEAGQTIDAALARQPESPVTHANMGWTLLHQGRPKDALGNFGEAVRLDPTSEWARSGIVEALKARNAVYAVMLKYFLFMGRLSTGVQWGIIIGGFYFGRLLSGMASANPGLAPWILPFRILYFSFVVMTWIAYPLFNLMLRLNPFGRMVLSPEQVVESNWLGTFLGLAVLSLGGLLIQGTNSPWLVSLVVFGLFTMPLSGTFRCHGGSRKIMTGTSGVLLVVGVGAVVQNWRAYQGNDLWIKSLADQSFQWLGWFGLGVLATSILANILSGRVERH